MHQREALERETHIRERHTSERGISERYIRERDMHKRHIRDTLGDMSERHIKERHLFFINLTDKFCLIRETMMAYNSRKGGSIKRSD